MKIEEKRHGETARQYAYRTLRENIISLDLEPGAPFNDVEMSQMIGISRTPVREAVIQLSEESRIIEIFPQRGMRIALIDVELVEEAAVKHLPFLKGWIPKPTSRNPDKQHINHSLEKARIHIMVKASESQIDNLVINL